MPAIRPTTTADPAAADWNRVWTCADKLWEAAEKVDDRRHTAPWGPGTTAKALTSLQAARAALDELIDRLEARAARPGRSLEAKRSSAPLRSRLR